VTSIHQRILSLRNEEIEKLNAQIRNASREHEIESLQRLELLLSHRDRLMGLRTWPIDMPMVTRLLLYVVIPLAAWSGAAVVEMAISAIISG
jgi:hypothetical protein